MKEERLTVRKIYSDGQRSLEFIKVERVPGFTHRVVVDGIATDWLASTHKPCAKVAAYFLGKHGVSNGRTLREASTDNS